MSTQITLKQSAIKAVSFAMAKNDIRYYLNGMCIQHNGEETRIIATDGHRLHMVRVEHKDGLVIDPIECIIPDTLVNTIIKAKASRHDKIREVILTIDGDKVSAVLPDGTEAISKLIDGKFPDYTRVIPESFNGQPAQYNIGYVSDIFAGHMAYHEVKRPLVGFNYNGDSCGGICYAGFCAIVMPLRAECIVSGLDFMKAPMRKPEAAESVA